MEKCRFCHHQNHNPTKRAVPLAEIEGGSYRNCCVSIQGISLLPSSIKNVPGIDPGTLSADSKGDLSRQVVPFHFILEELEFCLSVFFAATHALPIPICSVKNNDYNHHYFAICFLLSAIPLFAVYFLISTLIVFVFSSCISNQNSAQWQEVIDLYRILCEQGRDTESCQWPL